MSCKLFTTPGWENVPLSSFKQHVVLIDNMGKVMADMLEGFSPFTNITWAVALDPSGDDFNASAGSLTRAYFFIRFDEPFNGLCGTLFDNDKRPLLTRSYIGSVCQEDDNFIFK
jgi:hypothetical protein